MKLEENINRFLTEFVAPWEFEAAKQQLVKLIQVEKDKWIQIAEKHRTDSQDYMNEIKPLRKHIAHLENELAEQNKEIKHLNRYRKFYRELVDDDACDSGTCGMCSRCVANKVRSES